MDKSLMQHSHQDFIFSGTPRKGDLKKLEILNATITCLATIGFEKTTYESIAKQIGTRRAHVAYHFKDKQDIFLACIKYIVSIYQEESINHIKSSLNPKDKMMKFIEGPFLWAKKYPEQLTVMLLFYYLCSIRTEYKEIHHTIRESGLQRIQDIIIYDLEINITKERSLFIAKSIQNIMSGFLLDSTTINNQTLENAEIMAKKLISLVLEQEGLGHE